MVLHEIEKIYKIVDTIFMIRTYTKMNFSFYNIYSIISKQLTQVKSTQLNLYLDLLVPLHSVWSSFGFPMGHIQVYFWFTNNKLISRSIENMIRKMRECYINMVIIHYFSNFYFLSFFFFFATLQEVVLKNKKKAQMPGKENRHRAN